MKKLLLSIFILLASGTAFSQNTYYAPVQIGFIPPVCSNGSLARQYVNGASFNVLGGVSAGEKYFTFSGLYSVILGDAGGLQFAGLYNHVGNNGNGLLFGGLVNVVRGNYTGLQFAGLGNTVRDMRGLQFGGIGNIASDMSGLQFGGIFNVAANVTGLQFGGLVNIASDVRWFQFAGISNVTANAQGLQFAGIANIAADVTGLQFAGITNITGNARGFQFAGLWNTTGNVNGFQFAGLFNHARNVSGVQFAGLLNIAENSDYPIGLVNIIRNGSKAVGVTYDGLGNSVLAFRSGGRVFYGILGIGYNHKAPGDSFVTEAGYGIHINCTPWLRINNEFKAAVIGNFNDRATYVSTYALLPAFRIGMVEIFGGPTFNHMSSDNRANDALFPGKPLWERTSDSGWRATLHIGYQVGVQVVF